ncbi:MULTISPECIES: 2-dehydro-3-deoxy-D-gluconate 5-dehydrogenase KduD [unclassified Ensifer]|uniref:2-dehydro-3-deoxy-D-gluconate 5-dehydrogenase KduD n=1 Tax=unclassified Ensifer TaxID=2633371 RepID=UPI0008134D58|nr:MULTISPECIES: 2-dehydro-3-deoxy-D-gluconate 5-dehydrogenase KduD [unclassified Ensifer]OCO99932.1 2-deoxy-D-gluconate 3-dehydrogenase [Ensifer sp. LC13]OCP00127.1 2-deoxy-D-gluconate 3-dehydrogenase [Ensifer sp. LC11]OCP04018.1 2-deoxy-D-gluconate 3-dehydrogenase [Ensifer sp. LC14]OCP31019.1 2-deoxy-D-gluconate 3-dehydrogenase [Ensifer sp. LC499]
MNALFDLTGKTALVTGARTGLGQGMALALARAGANIAAIGSSPMPETAALVRETGVRFHEQTVDLSEPFNAANVVAGAAAALDGVDILVNNAGIIRRADLLDYSEEDWDSVLDVNLKAVFMLSQAAAKHMVSTGRAGRIVNVASMLTFQGGIRVPAYAASKHGIAGLTKAMANELAPRGITVNAIAPGYMATDNTEALRNDPDRNAQISARIPMGRWGTPDDLATAVLFFAAPASGYVTGTVLPVDGGWLVR